MSRRDFNKAKQYTKTEVDALKIDNENRNTRTTMNVSAFGPVGTTDDSDTIMAALNSSYDLVFDNRVYNITKRINWTMQTPPAPYIGRRMIDFNGAIIKFTGTGITLVSNKGTIHIINGNSLLIKNLILDTGCVWWERPYMWDTENFSAWNDARKHTTDGVVLYNCKDIIINDCTSRNGGTGFSLLECSDIKMNECKSIETFADGIFCAGSTNNVKVSQHHCYHVGDDCYSADGYRETDSLNPHNIIFSNCTALDCYGALTCLRGSHNTKTVDCVGVGIKYTPIKLGNLHVAYTSIGYNQTVENCIIICDDIIVGDGEDLHSDALIASGEVLNSCRNITISNTVIQRKSVGWIKTTAKEIGDRVYANGNIYECTVAGTTGTTAPSHSSGTAVDGTVTWTFISVFNEIKLKFVSAFGIKISNCFFEGFKPMFESISNLIIDNSELVNSSDMNFSNIWNLKILNGCKIRNLGFVQVNKYTITLVNTIVTPVIINNAFEGIPSGNLGDIGCFGATISLMCVDVMSLYIHSACVITDLYAPGVFRDVHSYPASYFREGVWVNQYSVPTWTLRYVTAGAFKVPTLT